MMGWPFRNLAPGVAAAALGFALLAAPAASADELERAKKAVNAASNEQLLAEFQRRSQTESGRLRGVGEKIMSRSVQSPLSTIDEGTLVMAMRATSRTIYGKDKREDWYEISDAGVRSVGLASVALFKEADTASAGAKVSLKTKSLGETWRLCSGERFETQSAAAFCSGTLVRPDAVLTAGHCMRESAHLGAGEEPPPPLKDIRFVFGFRMEDAKEPGGCYIRAGLFRQRPHWRRDG